MEGDEIMPMQPTDDTEETKQMTHMVTLDLKTLPEEKKLPQID
jgi:hypothetical protein